MGRYLDYPRATGEYVENATQTQSGFMSAADKAKLDGLTPGGGSSTLFRFIFFVQPGIGAGARSCPGAQVGDVVVNVCGYNNFGIPLDPAQDFSANFESVITVANQIQQLSGSLSIYYVLPVLRRTTA